MTFETHPTYFERTQLFLKTVLGCSDSDFIGIATGSPANRTSIRFAEFRSHCERNPLLAADNFWFCSSVMDGIGHRSANAISAKSIFIDVDYGSVGHKKVSPFPDMDSALRHVMGLPVKPQLVWATGHGLQAAYVLERAYAYGVAADRQKLARAKKLLYPAALSDSTSSAAALFRVPGTVNKKANCLPIQGEVIHDSMHIFG